MAYPAITLLLMMTACSLSCGKLSKGREVASRAAEEFQGQKAQALCDRFSDEMLAAMPCESLNRVMRQTELYLGRPTGKCKWNYNYNIVSLDPLRTVTIYKCPYAKESVKLTVVVDATDNGAFVSGLWSDSSILRRSRFLTRVELCKGVNQNNNRYEEPIEKASWSDPAVFVWTSWQGVKGGDELSMQWISPDGEEVTGFTHKVKQSANPYNFWSWIEPDEVNVKNPVGMWTVEIAVNGEVVEEYSVEFAKR